MVGFRHIENWPVVPKKINYKLNWGRTFSQISFKYSRKGNRSTNQWEEKPNLGPSVSVDTWCYMKDLYSKCLSKPFFLDFPDLCLKCVCTRIVCIQFNVDDGWLFFWHQIMIYWFANRNENTKSAWHRAHIDFVANKRISNLIP